MIFSRFSLYSSSGTCWLFWASGTEASFAPKNTTWSGQYCVDFGIGFFSGPYKKPNPGFFWRRDNMGQNFQGLPGIVSTTLPQYRHVRNHVGMESLPEATIDDI